MALIIAAELCATGSRSTRLFQTLLAGKTGHFGAPGRGEASGLPVRAAKAATATVSAITHSTPLRMGEGSADPALFHSPVMAMYQSRPIPTRNELHRTPDPVF